MAMVFLSDRKSPFGIKGTLSEEIQKPQNTTHKNPLENNINNNNIPYIPDIPPAIHIPFGIQSKGHEITINKNPNSPGPGSYNLNPTPKKHNSSINPFLFQSPRFISDLKDNIDIPGPGSYDIINKPITSKGRKIRPNSNVSFKYHTNSLNNITSIPNKNQKFGYIHNKNGELIQAIDPAINKYFSGTKKNSIGPDRYNIVYKENNPFVCWRKMSPRKLSSNESSIIMNNNDSKISMLDTEITCTVKSGKSRNKKIKKSYKELISDYKKRIYSSSMNQKKMNDTIEIDTEKELEFLNHENNRILKKKKKNFYLNFNKLRYNSPPEEFQFFGSSNQRFVNKQNISNDNPNVGPGSYFLNTKNIFKNKKTNIDNWGKNVGREQKLKKSNSCIGPGSYNIMKDFNKKSFNSFGSFSSEKRFDLSYDQNNIANSYKNENGEIISYPGPGSYNISEEWIKDKMSNFIKKPILVNVEKEIKKFKIYKEKENKPDFNTYQNQQMIDIIQTNIKNKINPFADQKFPFMHGEERFKKNKNLLSNVNLGPGKYDIYKYDDLRIGKKVSMGKFPFNSNEEKKMSYLSRSNSDLSPGEYNLDSYFDWNKKSFNVMFV